MEQVFQRHLADVDKWAAARANVKMMRLAYHRVLSEPQTVAEEVAAFFGVALDVRAMIAQVDANLYRNRMK
jgi:hypothetical protein